MKQWRLNPMPKTRGTVNSYWIEQREKREPSRKRRQAASRKRTSRKQEALDKTVDLWDKVI